MLYGLLLKSSELSLLGNERAACMADAQDDEESWLLGLEAWVPCFALARDTERDGQCLPSCDLWSFAEGVKSIFLRLSAFIALGIESCSDGAVAGA